MAMRNQQDLYSYIAGPEFQQKWAYGPRTAQDLFGGNQEEYDWFKSTGFQPFQPNAQTNVQNIDGVWKNTMVQPGETPKQFTTVTSAPIGQPTNAMYAKSIGATLPQPAAAAAPPTPAAPAAPPLAATTQFQLPTGFNIRTGSTDPTDPRGQNQLVYGANYFPGNLPGFEGILNKDQFFALSPEQQGDYREALYYAAHPEMRPQGGLDQFLGGRQQQQGGPPANTPPPAAPTTPPGPGNAPGGSSMYPVNGGGLRVNPNYLPEIWDYQDSPEYQWRLAQAMRNANRVNLAMGRSNSTFGMNAMNRLASDIAAEEVNRQYERALAANMANYSRMLGANQINYGRTREEDETGWNRATYMNERDWTRGNYMTEQEWNRAMQMARLGYDATNQGVNAGNQTSFAIANLLRQNGAEQAAAAVANGTVDANLIDQLFQLGYDFLTIEQLIPQLTRRGTTAPTTTQTPSTGTTQRSSIDYGATSQGRDYFGGSPS
jgi:hypothetical protein